MLFITIQDIFWLSVIGLSIILVAVSLIAEIIKSKGKSKWK